MVSAVLKIKDFVKTIAKDISTDLLLQLTHLKSSASTESILSLDGETPINPLAQINYGAWNHNKIPSLEVHLKSRHESLVNVREDCPWCNRYYFDWLMDHGILDFIENIDHETYPTPVSATLPKFTLDTEKTQPNPFKLFTGSKLSAKQQRNREYHRETKASHYKERSIKNLGHIQEKSVVEVADYVDHHQFAKLPKSQDAARAWIMNNTLYNPEDLDTYPIDNNLFVLPSAQYMRGPDFPKYLIMRFDEVIPKDINDKLWSKWCEMRKTLRRFEQDQNTRDVEPQLHAGMWAHYRDHEYVISDTYKQSPEAKAHLKEFLAILRDNVVPRIWALLRRHDPDTFKRHMHVRDTLAKKAGFMSDMSDFPWIDFGGAFYAMAIKDGGSQKIHLDWMDHSGTYAWILNIGPSWKGGDLCFPQLGKRVPTRPGQVIAFQGRYLAHCASPTLGDRLVITCFSDRSLMGRALATFKSLIPRKRSRNPDATRKRAKRGRKNTEA